MSAEFVAAMEDVLDLYEEPYDPQRPTVCFDETSTQLIGESRIPLPARPGRRERFDYEYRRNGTRNLFMLCEPLRGWRHVAVTERRRMGDFAHQMRWLADEAYTKAEKIRVVLDNLNTHRPASLYETFDPAEARRILKRLEFHYTPKHGSWLNMAEIELSVFSRQCLNRRIPDGATLTRELAALVRRRNEAHATIAWRFTTSAARTTLRHLYPTQQNHLDWLLEHIQRRSNRSWAYKSLYLKGPVIMMPNILRVYTGDDGLSHIEEIDLPFEAFTDTEGAYGEGTPFEGATGITFRRDPPGYFLDWHDAPRRQYVITIRGEIEIGASDGTLKRIGPGDILLAEDLTGRGHTCRLVAGDIWFYVAVPLGETAVPLS